MTGLRRHRRGFLAMSASACLARSTRAAEVDEPAPVDWGEPISISGIAPGDWKTVLLEGDPVFLRRRNRTQIAAARATPLSDLPDPAADEERAPGGEWLVVSGICTHAACQVQAGLGPYDGWQCFCHGSAYDLSGRVRQGPARRNLPVVRHALAGETMVLRRS
jgi:ubiquinol-cytochrome c reductase iron-sulfur subunit